MIKPLMFIPESLHGRVIMLVVFTVLACFLLYLDKCYNSSNVDDEPVQPITLNELFSIGDTVYLAKAINTEQYNVTECHIVQFNENSITLCDVSRPDVNYTYLTNNRCVCCTPEECAVVCKKLNSALTDTRV